jgi:hypothetical protein
MGSLECYQPHLPWDFFVWLQYDYFVNMLMGNVTIAEIARGSEHSIK